MAAPAIPKNLIKIGEVLRQQRKLRHLTQKQLAAKVNVSQCYLAQIEKGRRLVSLPILEKFSNYFEMPLGILFFLTLDSDDVCTSKKKSFNQIAPAIYAMIEKFFL
jgi:transcriptional regulator with XRE-family HTH domain